VASKPESKHYTGRIVDRATATPIHEARVTVLTGSNHAGPYRSDSEGDFSFWLARKNPSDDADVHIEHESYRAYDRTVSSDQKTQLGDIRLEALLVSRAGTPQESSATSPADSKAPQSINRLTATRVPASERPGGLAGLVALPTTRNEIHPNRSTGAALEIATAAPPPRIVENSSGQKLSGKGKGWSPWYQVRVALPRQRDSQFRMPSSGLRATELADLGLSVRKSLKTTTKWFGLFAYRATMNGERLRRRIQRTSQGGIRFEMTVARSRLNVSLTKVLPANESAGTVSWQTV